MRHSVAAHATLLAVTSALSVGCHRPAAQTAPAPRASLEGEHCWWAAYRTALR
jgi:hypothetical protein